MKNIFLSLLGITFLTLCSCAEKVDYETDRQAIEDVLEEWDKNAESGDLADNADYYTTDALRIGAGTILSGKEEIRDAFQNYAGTGRITKNENTLEDLWISGDLAVKWGTFSGVYEPNNGSYATYPKQAGTSVYERQKNGSWKMILTVSTDLTEHNKLVSEMYHELDPENMDEILTEDFIGRNERSRNTWTKKIHKEYWSNNKGVASDKIIMQVAEGNWVATWFTRSGEWEGSFIEMELMQFKRFENGKISEIWEYGDVGHLEAE